MFTVTDYCGRLDCLHYIGPTTVVWHNNQCYKKVVLDSFHFDGHIEHNDRPSKLLKSLKCTQLWLDQCNVILFLVKKSH